MIVRPSISVVVPVYNGAATLPALVARLLTALPPLTDRFEIVFVNDGSRDRSWELLERLADPRIRAIDLMRNYGQHNALLVGIRAATNEVVITIDDDLQHPPEEIGRLLEKLTEGPDVVYGYPAKEQHTMWRALASRITKWALQGAMGADVARSISAFRAFRTNVRDGFASYRSPYVNLDVLLTWGTDRFAAVPVRHDPRAAGVSNYSFRKLLVHALNMATGFSTFPLHLASLMGFALTLFGVGVLLFVVLRLWIEGGSVPGFPFLASIVAIFSGAQLFALGIIGEYLARVHFRTMDRPAYAIRSDRGAKHTR